MIKKLSIAVISVLMLALMAIPTFAETTRIVANETELLSALNVAEEGDTIKLSASIELATEAIVIKTGKNITIDLNGKRLLAPFEAPAIDVCGELAIIDSDVDGEGNGKGYIEGNKECVVLVRSGGVFTLNNGTITGGDPEKEKRICGGGVDNWGTFNMAGGKISGCTATMGGGLSCEEGSETYIYGGVITGCYATQAGGGIFCDWKSKLNMTGGEINQCVADWDGGGMATTPPCEVHLSDCRIINNNSGIANGCGPGKLYIGGNVVVMGNDKGTGVQNNICILRDILDYKCDFPITIEEEEPLGTEAKVGLHLNSRNYSNVVVSSGALEDYITSGKLSADFEGDTLIFEDGKVLLDLAEFTVTFDSQGGSDVAPVKVKRGQYVPKPKTPTKEGYEFVGWFPLLTSTEPWDFGYDIITEDTTIYARWKEPTPNPATGDYSNTILWSALIGAAAVAIVVLLIALFRKKKYR